MGSLQLQRVVWHRHGDARQKVLSAALKISRWTPSSPSFLGFVFAMIVVSVVVAAVAVAVVSLPYLDGIA
eukprot:1665928-Amphidinium_carterae.1